MTRFVHRLGRLVEADEAFEAWMSGDIKRMVLATAVPTNPIDRHFLLQSIVKEAYPRRADRRMRALCIEIGRKHLAEFPSIAPVLAAEMGGELPTVPSFKWLAAALAEDGQLDEAVAICQVAAGLGLKDGTKGGYPARAARLRASGRASGEASCPLGGAR